MLEIDLTNAVPDRQYRMLILLQRTDRPRYYSFHCFNCKTLVAELAGSNVFAAEDFYNPQSTTNASVGIRCNGKYCHRYYFFQLK